MSTTTAEAPTREERLRAAQQRVRELEEELDEARRALEDEVAEAAQDEAAGLSFSAIGRVLGCSKTHAYKQARASELYQPGD